MLRPLPERRIEPWHILHLLLHQGGDKLHRAVESATTPDLQDAKGVGLAVIASYENTDSFALAPTSTAVEPSLLIALQRDIHELGSKIDAFATEKTAISEMINTSSNFYSTKVCCLSLLLSFKWPLMSLLSQTEKNYAHDVQQHIDQLKYECQKWATILSLNGLG